MDVWEYMQSTKVKKNRYKYMDFPVMQKNTYMQLEINTK